MQGSGRGARDSYDYAAVSLRGSGSPSAARRDYAGLSMPRIFVSYRREDSPGSAGRLYDKLYDRYGAASLFRDVDTLAPGDDFVEAIESKLNECDVLLAVIGPRWLQAEDLEHRRRLDLEMDYVRLEIQTALQRKIRVVPVLVEGARMPRRDELPEVLQPLSRKQAVELTDIRWAYDVGHLVNSLGERGQAAQVPPTPQQPFIPQAPPPRPVTAAPVEIGVQKERLFAFDYTVLLANTIVASADSRRLAYVEKVTGFLGVGNGQVVAVNGVKGKKYDQIDEHLAFSPDGARVAYLAQSQGKWCVVINESEGRHHDSLIATAPLIQSGRAASGVWGQGERKVGCGCGREGRSALR